MSKLWQKGTETLDKEIEKFEVADDYLLDMKIASFDIYGCAAHAIMLEKIGILSKEELTAIIKGLKGIMDEIEANKFVITVTDEDVHTKVENLLIQRIGDAGKKLHTARSRNDQVLVDIRMYSKYQILEIILRLLDLCQTLLKFAKQYEFVPMPGYTHMQLAMPSSVGMWTSSFIESFIDLIHLLHATYQYNDMNPLGSGAGYGVSLDIDRVLTTCLLGFERIQKNSLYCANSRGFVEANIVSALSSIGLNLNRIASDLLLFTTKEFGFFKICTKITTGSSIMPQKKNLDVMELVRARTHVILGNEQQLKGIIANLPSGYNRDYQETKRCIIQSFENVSQMILITKVVFENIEPDEEKLRSAHKPEMYAADLAYKMVREGMPFRDAYRQVGKKLDTVKMEDPVENIKSKTHLGSTGNLQLEAYEQAIVQEKMHWTEKSHTFKALLAKLLEKTPKNC